jgi:PmbA protein
MNLHNLAEQALAALQHEGADAAQASASQQALSELNIAHNEASLLRSTQNHKLSLVGIWDGRKATTELSDLSPEGLAQVARTLRENAASAPQDAANAVSGGQRVQVTRGPQEADLSALADAAIDVLHYRAHNTPSMNMEEGAASHTQAQVRVLTSGGSDLSFDLGWYGLSIFGTAKGPGADGTVRSSSFNYAGGDTEDLRHAPAHRQFGIAEVMQGLTRSVDTQGVAACFGGKFVGDVVLTPMAMATLLGWLQGQLSDMALITGSSVYREQVGQLITSPLLSLASRFDAPGVANMSADGFVTPPVELLRQGQLQTLIPSLYGSRKTGLKHVPTAASGWALAAGGTALAELVQGVSKGALVGRLSMGVPAANGDFSGIIKNSFAIQDGKTGTALSETMINGNVAQMLRDVVAVSQERLDTGGTCMPWVRVSGLHFS